MRLPALLLALVLGGCGEAAPTPPPDAGPPEDAALQFEDAAPPEPDLAPHICLFDVDTFDGDCLLAP